MRTLHLNLKKKWFDMIASGEKGEEYREIKPFYYNRFFDGYDETGCIDPVDFQDFQDYDTITFSNGYSKDRRQMVVEFDSITISLGLAEWGADDNYCFVIGLGEILNRNFN